MVFGRQVQSDPQNEWFLYTYKSAARGRFSHQHIVVGYFFDNPLTLHCEADEEPEVLLEEETGSKYNSKVSISFFPWIPLSAERKNIPCSADWVVTIVKPQEQLVKLYEEKINGRNESDQSPVVI